MPVSGELDVLGDLEGGLRDLDDESLREMRDDWRQQFVVPNRFPGSSNTMFVQKARRVEAIESEMRRRGLKEGPLSNK
jgi:hypothetical protein